MQMIYARAKVILQPVWVAAWYPPAVVLSGMNASKNGNHKNGNPKAMDRAIIMSMLIIDESSNSSPNRITARLSVATAPVSTKKLAKNSESFFVILPPPLQSLS